MSDVKSFVAPNSQYRWLIIKEVQRQTWNGETRLLPSTISPCQVSFYHSYFKQNTAIYVIDTVSLKYYSYFIPKSHIASWLRKMSDHFCFDFCFISANFYSERKWLTLRKSHTFRTRFLSRQYDVICGKDKGNIIQISLVFTI